MCDNDENLIDLSVESEFLEIKKTDLSNPSNKAIAGGGSVLLTPANCSEAASELRRDSIENNPFDAVQKLVKRLDDPFESAESEACFKAHCSTLRHVDVKEGNLLSLSDDDTMCSDWNTYGKTLKAGENTTVASSVFYSLENISPPVSFYKTTPETSGNSGAESGGSSTDTSAKTKTALELRKRLLKQSISNSTFNSPLSRYSAACMYSKGHNENDEASSPLINKFFKNAFDEEKLLSSESPLKFADDGVFDDLPHHLSDKQTDYDADLEMMQIPMLKELTSPLLEETPTCKELPANGQPNIGTENTITSPLLSLEAIRAKLQAKREASKLVPPDVSRMISDLKSLISHMTVTDEHEKQEASTLLETLSSALAAKEIEEQSHKQNDSSTAGTQVPGAIVRQGTFNVELQDNAKQDKNADPNASDCQELHTAPSMKTADIPDVMLKSSATYDGETSGEKHDLVLPEIAPVTPPSAQNTMQQDWNDIIEQLTKIFEQQQEINGDPGNGIALPKQTFIVVPVPFPSAASSRRASPEATESDDPFHHEGGAMYRSARRRSQSLSIHDKIRVLQFPLKEKNDQTQKEDISPVLSPPRDVSMRMMKRRNSFSCGTPATPTASCTMTEIISRPRTFDTPARPSALFPRRLTALSTHHEQQHTENAEFHHLPLPLNNLHRFIPELKKRPHKSNENSVMKSSVPLKATIPVKKVAPMVKISASTPIHPSIKSRGKYATSTPVPVTVGNPKACSTPTVSLKSPFQNSTVRLTNPRYSINANTPSKQPQPPPAKDKPVLTKRRSFSEVRPKSPMRPRLSSYGAKPPSMPAPKPLIKPSAKSNLSKTPNKLEAPGVDKRALTSKMTPRASFKGFNPGVKNKENRQP